MLKTCFLFIILLLTCSNYALADSRSRQLFQLDGFDYNETELSPELQQQLYRLDVQYRQQLDQLIDAALLDIYLQEQAEQRAENVDKATLIDQLFPVEPPSEQAIRAFYNVNQQRIQRPLAQARDQIERYLIQQQRQTKQIELVAKLKQQRGFQALLPRPQPPAMAIASDGYPSKGSPDAPITIVEFSDYRCPHCRDAAPRIRRVVERYPDQVRLVYMDQLVISGNASRRVAEGAVCADQAGRFWDYHDLAFVQQQQLNEAAPKRLAQTLGLDLDTFMACLDAPETKAKVARSKAEADRLGVNQTPTLFINGRRLVTDNLEQGLEDAITQLLDSKSAQ